MTHKLGHWMYLLLNSRIRNRAINHPSRQSLAVQKALSKLRLRYRVAVPFINPEWHGHKGDIEYGMQWLDFCVWNGKRMFVILFDTKGTRSGGPNKAEVMQLNAKVQYLTKRKIPLLLVRRGLTSMEYMVNIGRITRKEDDEP